MYRFINKFVLCLSLLVWFSTLGHAQEGFYAGGGLLFLNASEEVTSKDNQYNFTAAASFSNSTSTLPQAFPNVGLGGHVGYKHIFGKNPEKLRFWAGMEFSYNRQNMNIQLNLDSLNYQTTIHHSFGPTITVGIQKNKLSFYTNVFGFLSQRWNNSNSLVPNGTMYDLDDAKISKGAEHPTFSKGVYTGVRTMGLGVEYALRPNLCVRAAYTASKHVEYRHENAEGNYFDAGLGVYQTTFGLTYYIWTPKRLRG